MPSISEEYRKVVWLDLSDLKRVKVTERGGSDSTEAELQWKEF